MWWGRLFFGFAIQGSDGAKLYSQLTIVSNHYFEKIFSDAFSSKKLVRFIKENNIQSVAICGIDEGGCVSATAKGALKHGLKVEMLTDSINTCFPIKKVEKIRDYLKRHGAKYV